MRKPLIAITADLEGTSYLLKTNYVDMVVKAGGLPAVLPPLRELSAEQVERYDGFILTGGDDIDTTVWGEGLHPKACIMDPRRQSGEWALLDALAARPSVPVLGICLGMQVMCAHAGGKLHQHLGDVFANGEAHIGNKVHRVSGELGDGLVTSQHHQGVADPGRLRIVASAPDGIVEALRAPDRRFYLGVQWHPERTEDPTLSLALFQSLIREATG